MNIRNRKGTTMVEAAMIFPLVIAAVAAVLYIVTGLYASLSLQTSVHMALRKESGEISKTVYRNAETAEHKSEKDWVGIRPIIRMEEERTYRINTVFQNSITKTEAGRTYVIDEAELMRILSFDKEGSH